MNNDSFNPIFNLILKIGIKKRFFLASVDKNISIFDLPFIVCLYFCRIVITRELTKLKRHNNV